MDVQFCSTKQIVCYRQNIIIIIIIITKIKRFSCKLGEGKFKTTDVDN